MKAIKAQFVVYGKEIDVLNGPFAHLYCFSVPKEKEAPDQRKHWHPIVDTYFGESGQVRTGPWVIRITRNIQKDGKDVAHTFYFPGRANPSPSDIDSEQDYFRTFYILIYGGDKLEFIDQKSVVDDVKAVLPK